MKAPFTYSVPKRDNLGFPCREKDRGAKLVLDMIGALTQITDPENPGRA